MRHKEGGWPAHIDPTEPADQAEYNLIAYADISVTFSYVIETSDIQTTDVQ